MKDEIKNFRGADLSKQEITFLEEFEEIMGKKFDQSDVPPPENYMKFYSQEGYVTSLEIFGLKVPKVPSSISDLTNLGRILFSNNNLQEIPYPLVHLPDLKSLSLINNSLTNLPSSIGNFKELLKLNLNENFLSSLPNEIGSLFNLEKLSLRRNKLRELPKSLGNLSNLKKLNKFM